MHCMMAKAAASPVGSSPSPQEPTARTRPSSPFYIAVLCGAIVLLAPWLLAFVPESSLSLLAFVPEFPLPDFPFALPFFPPSSSSSSSPTNHHPPAAVPESDTTPAVFTCDESHPYRTEIVSLSPLIIYIHSFLPPPDMAALLRTGEPHFAPSRVDKPLGRGGPQQRTVDRTSSSAGLPLHDPAVSCVLRRARRFMGAMLRDGFDEMGPPQLVRYTAGQRFNMHNDWWRTPRVANDGSGRTWNRVASFFVGLQDGCTGGETYFPFVEPTVVASDGDEGLESSAAKNKDKNKKTRTKEEQEEKENEEKREMARRWTEDDPPWRRHPRGGVAFRPIAGNAVFWVNLHANETGDERTKHAGLPIGEGLKTAMNIWPRQFYAP